MNKQRLLEDFFELVQIDSEKRNERAIADVLTLKMEALGFDGVEDNDLTIG